MTAAIDVNWNRAAPQPWQAVVILDHEVEADMTTIAYRGADGLLYGCRDISHGENHDALLAAWTDTEEDLQVEDLRAKPDVAAIVRHAFVGGRPVVYTDLVGARRVALYSRRRGGPGQHLPPRLSIMSVTGEHLMTVPMASSQAIAFVASLGDAAFLPTEGRVA